MAPIQKNCRECQTPFEITDSDLQFYEQISPIFNNKKYPIPPPSLCPPCRQRRRLAFRNERSLYQRKCDRIGKPIISMYSPEKPYPVYDRDVWWSDEWDGLSYGQAFDFSKSFFEQFYDLMKKVPRINMTLSHCENSDYGPYCVSSKNIYMCNSCVDSEDIFYSYQANHSRDCVDCMLCYNSELCYECVYGVNLYHSAFSLDCRDSRDLWFCRDCQGCEQCIGCVNLVQKKHHVFNKPVSESEYKEWLQRLKTPKDLAQLNEQFINFSLKFPCRALHNIQVENCIGDRLIRSKNARYAFDAEDLEDCAYIYVLPMGAKDTHDTHYSPKAECVYEAMSATHDYRAAFVNHAWDVKESCYVDHCFYSSHLFGCIGLKKNEYCILNKQYTKEEYEILVPKIIEHMKGTGEWGEYFPMKTSPYAYNETIAQDVFPSTKERATQEGLTWKENEKKEYASLKNKKDIFACELCGKNYRLIPQELKFYHNHEIPIPRQCPDCRYKRRLAQRSAHKIWPRTCAKCNAPIQTTYAPGRPEIVDCEGCYLKEVY
ncbi:MAG: hypothetical protein WC882_00330 [Candidatus Gracilibacteria bacterium]